ncbi:MAG: M23 family metallopeptidase, partial [Bacillota bacterium]|nr:M23 family metallopeptidase [Bacillota bacterium]
FRFKIVSENNYTPKEKIRENMATFSSALMKGCSIYVDGKKVVVLKSPREAQEVLMAIKEQYYLKGMECTSEIMNKVELVNEQATYASSSTIEQAVRALNDVKDSSRDYMVKSGDTLWGIARSFNTTVQNLIKLNPNIGEKIKADETIQVPSPKPIVDVKTVILNAVIEESIPNTMIEVQDPSLYVGQSKITDYGSDGWHKITADITKINGEEDVSKRVIKSEKIVAEPVPGHIHIGTTAVPKGIGSGKFSWPLRGPITSKFGPRWGSVHTGVDIAVSAGTGVHASDEGRVIFTGWNSSGYGNLIKVDHCNGYQTYYAHLSKIYVKTGDVVAKGEVIAASGSTGNSTGPHLHFEVRKNGSSQNPLKYLP